MNIVCIYYTQYYSNLHRKNNSIHSRYIYLILFDVVLVAIRATASPLNRNTPTSNKQNMNNKHGVLRLKLSGFPSFQTGQAVTLSLFQLITRSVVPCLYIDLINLISILVDISSLFVGFVHFDWWGCNGVRHLPKVMFWHRYFGVVSCILISDPLLVTESPLWATGIRRLAVASTRTARETQWYPVIAVMVGEL